MFVFLGTKCNLQTNEKFSFDHKKFLPYSSRGHKLFIHSVCVCVPSDDFNPLHFWRFIPSGLFRYGEFLISKVCILNSTMVCPSYYYNIFTRQIQRRPRYWKDVMRVKNGSFQSNLLLWSTDYTWSSMPLSATISGVTGILLVVPQGIPPPVPPAPELVRAKEFFL